jgi:3-oxoacyl-[acyl-carrier-protein] synthase III
MKSVSIRSVAASFPSRRLPNDHWRRHHPAMVAAAVDKAESRVWREPGEGNHFERAMAPYFRDPFLGAVDRRWLERNESILEHEVAATERCLRAAGVTTKDVDLAIVSSVWPDHPDVGNAAYVAQRTGIRAAFNLESMCASSSVAVANAAAFIQAGMAKRVLVVSSCSYSTATDETDTLAWANGDGAAAILLDDGDDGALLGCAMVASHNSNGALYSPFVDVDGSIERRMQITPGAGAKLAADAEPLLRQSMIAAITHSGRTVNDIDFFVLPAGVAWMESFVTSAFGIPAHKMLTRHASYANTGPVMMPTHLLHATEADKLPGGSVACVVGIGSTSGAAATVWRIGDLHHGALP